MRFVGVDLAWGEGSDRKPANETGLCVIDEHGAILDAGWARGIDAVAAWILAAGGGAGAARASAPAPAPAQAQAAAPAVGPAPAPAPPDTGVVVAIDAPLVVPNATGMREAEKQVGRAYGRWKVSANASSQTLKWIGGVTLRDRLEESGFRVSAGTWHPEPHDRVMFECYPYTTLVGMEELGYDVERPRYKRLDTALPAAEARLARAAATDELVRRLATLATADPPLRLDSHPLTRAILETPSPLSGPAHKHREDLIDAALCAWTASIWHRHGAARVQILGEDAGPDEPQDPAGRPATIIAPARPTQRLPRTPPRPGCRNT